MKLKSVITGIATFLVVSIVAFLAFNSGLPAAKALDTSGNGGDGGTIHLAAVGDSLTHGVGDTTHQGGYVPLIAQDMQVATNRKVATSNYGVTGDTARQIQKRVRTQKKLQTSVKNADIITMTVGGNDLMHLLQKNMLSINTKDVTKGINTFQKHLTSLISDVRALNPNAPIYVFGIYNPFYVYFPNITKMQTSVQRWNKQTQKTLATLNKVYYVDIDSVLSKGNGQKKASSAKKQKAVNNLIYGKDHFHPNNAGYEQMTTQLWDVMKTTEGKWNK
ncbi:SGNH/GDSL hydrolase family protein [Lacticaseibacillus songhuajiangensis]|uniref:SGNH/GDSL hydrolase family protein n=1 Tax=Lacticaseibacillus songhuajiangensis TaxID=1296539 RepID=UPI000F778B0E|nr:SGNH/GDSL hydrolase family protein [Lacticaseibacillus songhuajiangensis]